MKKILFYSILMSGIVGSRSLLAQHGSLEVTVSNIKSVQGAILVTLFANESEFLKKAFQSQRIKVEGDKAIVTFSELPLGNYALSVIHDENENGKLDTNFVGIPNEGFAFGNDALGTFGPPSFEKTVLVLGEGITKHAIKLKYY